MYTLYDYFRSTASYRVRIVLALKELSYQCKEVHLINGGGEQLSPTYSQLNPEQLVPTLVENTTDFTLSQSLAIIEYLESQHPTPSLGSDDPKTQALIKSVALSICCDMHPLNNLRVLNYLKNTLHLSDDQKKTWYHHWLHKGFTALETQLSAIKRNQPFCFSDRITLADVCLIPQWYNACRFKMDLSSYPLLSSINEHCLALEPFKSAAP